MSTVYVKRDVPTGPRDGSASHPFETISKAIAVAATGAHIHIAAGSYHENLRITKPVHIHGGPSATTVIVGSLSEASIVRFEASGSIDYVTLIPDKSQAGNTDVEVPIGIAIRKGAKTVEVNFCTIDSCSVGVETAVCDASVMINGSTLIRNQYGIGAVLTTGTVYCANSQITDNFT
jgi:nitrous oxidase accessory protein NosD